MVRWRSVALAFRQMPKEGISLPSAAPTPSNYQPIQMSFLKVILFKLTNWSQCYKKNYSRKVRIFVIS
jgi:hypothetical protein